MARPRCSSAICNFLDSASSFAFLTPPNDNNTSGFFLSNRPWVLALEIANSNCQRRPALTWRREQLASHLRSETRTQPSQTTSPSTKLVLKHYSIRSLSYLRQWRGRQRPLVFPFVERELAIHQKIFLRVILTFCSSVTSFVSFSSDLASRACLIRYPTQKRTHTHARTIQ